MIIDHIIVVCNYIRTVAISRNCNNLLSVGTAG